MDFSVAVSQKLMGRDKCIKCLLASRSLSAEVKEPVIMALVECGGDFGLLLFSCKKIPVTASDDISVDTVIPINEHFTWSLVPPLTKQTSGSQCIEIRAFAKAVCLELPPGELTKAMLSELKRTQQVYSNNLSFDIVADFSWLFKYKEKSAKSLEIGTDAILDPLSNDKGWPFSAILQSNVGKDCPIVSDTRTMDHVISVLDQTSMTDSGSFHDTLSNLDSDEPLRRSYDHSIDQLSMAVNSQTVTNRRDDLIKHLMKQREEEYTDIKTYRLFCGTWNTNGQPASAPIHAWLSPSEDDVPPDIYAIGFQELDLSKNAYIFSESAKEEEWYKRVKEALHFKAKYKRVKLIRLVGIMLVVFIRAELAEYIYDVMCDTVGTGVLGMMGNKGGVGVRFGFHNTSICFVNSHLAAHTEEFERRNQDFRDISSKMVFSKSRAQEECGIADHDMVFWIGDLNYRLSDIENERAKQMIEKQQLTELMNYDQLCRQIALKKVFLDYVEGRINFRPTYKYDPGTNNWDSSEKCRTPAWCDRVLWRGPNIRQLKYRSHMECCVSDHKPVSTLFDIGIKVINRKEYRLVYEDIMKQLDRMENEYLPQVALSTTEVYFNDVKFVEPQQKLVTVTNTGQGLVQFEFINKPRDNAYCKPWLTVMPVRGIIDVGQKLEIQIEVYVNTTTVGPLNMGDDKFEDILVLHLEGGKDLFITVSGDYIPSSFGCSIETLVNMFNPIRKMVPSQLKQLVRRGELSSDRPLDVPKELYWLIDHLYRYGLWQEDLFHQPGLASEIQEIRECLDEGNPQDIAGQIHSVAEALLVFLEALPEPVIPYEAHTRCLDCSSSFSACKQVLMDIPKSHRNVFKYICAFLRELLHCTTQNNLDAKSLAVLFSGLLMRSKPAASKDKMTGLKKSASCEEERKYCAFVYHFLINEYDG